MSTLRVDNIKSRTGTVVTVPETNTLAVTGIVSVTSGGSITNSGNLSVDGNATIAGSLDVSGGGSFNTTGIITCGGLDVTGNITSNFIGNLTGTATTATNASTLLAGATGDDLTLSGNLTVNGTSTTIDTATLSVEDKNIGIGSVTTPTNTTATGGGLTLFGGADGDKSFTWNQSGVQNYWQVAGGQLFTAEGLNTRKMLSEQVNVGGASLNNGANVDLELGMTHLRTANLGADVRPNIRYSSSRTLDNTMNTGEGITVTIVHAVDNAAYNVSGLEIDGTIQTVNWIGGSAPSDGGSSGVDIYTFHIIKTAANTYTTIGSQTKTS